MQTFCAFLRGLLSKELLFVSNDNGFLFIQLKNSTLLLILMYLVMLIELISCGLCEVIFLGATGNEYWDGKRN